MRTVLGPFGLDFLIKVSWTYNTTNLGTTRVPSTRERSSSPAWVGDSGDGNDGLLTDRGDAI